MSATQYILNLSVHNGTGNITHMLNPVDVDIVRTFNPIEVEEAFGPGDEGCTDMSKGYGDPEWYWVSSKGHVWGIGWRWGQARLRGKSLMRTAPENRPTAEDASEFVAFLKQELV